MQLTYRGVKYEPYPTALELTEGEIGAKYRGENWRHHYPRHIPVPQLVVELKYRGVAYCSGNSIDDDVEASLPSSRPEVIALTKTHLANIRQNLAHRLQVARARGDRQLIRLLEAEAEQIV